MKAAMRLTEPATNSIHGSIVWDTTSEGTYVKFLVTKIKKAHRRVVCIDSKFCTSFGWKQVHLTERCDPAKDMANTIKLNNTLHIHTESQQGNSTWNKWFVDVLLDAYLLEWLVSPTKQGSIHGDREYLYIHYYIPPPCNIVITYMYRHHIVEVSMQYHHYIYVQVSYCKSILKVKVIGASCNYHEMINKICSTTSCTKLQLTQVVTCLYAFNLWWVYEAILMDQCKGCKHKSVFL